MAYVTYYTAHHTNLLNEDVHINIMKKDGLAPTIPEELEVISFRRTSDADSSSLEAPIIRQNIELIVHLTDDNSITWETFFEYEHDDWKIEVTVDEQPVFHGWMQPDEGRVPFEDKPYEFAIRGADGIALLKNTPLTKADNTNFSGKFTLIQYIAAILQKVGYNLPIKVTCDIFEVTMFNKYNSIDWDMFQQAKLAHQTFQKNAIEYVNCYEALEIILGNHFRLFYDYDPATNQAVWHIFRIPQYQYTPTVKYYVLYDYDGANPNGFEDPENYGQVGKHHIVYKTNSATRSGKFAVKGTRLTHTYEIWPEIPLNNKFQHGSSMGTSGNVETFNINDWSWGQFTQSILSQSSNLPNLNINPNFRYSRRTYDAYGIEKEREVILQRPPAGGGEESILMCTGIPVNAGDKIELSFDKKFSASFTGTATIIRVYLIPEGSAFRYSLEQYNSSMDRVFWRRGTRSQRLTYFYDSGTGDSTTEYKSFSIEAPVVPETGHLYIMFSAPSYSEYSFFRSFDFRLTPFISGGYIPVKGHYYEVLQDSNYIDRTDETIRISDNVVRVSKGCLFRADGTTATVPSWYVFGGPTQIKHYIQLATEGRFNTEYRRFWRFEGTFTGTKFSPENDQLNYQPLSFRKTYKFMDTDELVECVLIPPLQIDYSTGEIQAIFEEVKREAFADGTQTGDSSRFNYIFE